MGVHELPPLAPTGTPRHSNLRTVTAIKWRACRFRARNRCRDASWLADGYSAKWYQDSVFMRFSGGLQRHSIALDRRPPCRKRRIFGSVSVRFCRIFVRFCQRPVRFLHGCGGAGQGVWRPARSGGDIVTNSFSPRGRRWRRSRRMRAAPADWDCPEEDAFGGVLCLVPSSDPLRGPPSPPLTWIGARRDSCNLRLAGRRPTLSEASVSVTMKSGSSQGSVTRKSGPSQGSVTTMSRWSRVWAMKGLASCRGFWADAAGGQGFSEGGRSGRGDYPMGPVGLRR